MEEEIHLGYLNPAETTAISIIRNLRLFERKAAIDWFEKNAVERNIRKDVITTLRKYDTLNIKKEKKKK